MVQIFTKYWERKLFCKLIYFFISLRAGGILQILQSDWFRERAVFYDLARANPGGIVGSFIHKFVCCCEWAKPVIQNHFSFKTCAIISVSWGKVNFVIQTKQLKGESRKSARKTAKVKHSRRLVMSLHYFYNLRCKYCNLALMHRLFDIFPPFVGLFSIFAVWSRFCRFSLNFASLVFYFSEKVVVNDCM